MQSKAQGRIFSLFDLERISEDELESKVYENAKDGLTILSNKLGVDTFTSVVVDRMTKVWGLKHLFPFLATLDWMQ